MGGRLGFVSVGPGVCSDHMLLISPFSLSLWVCGWEKGETQASHLQPQQTSGSVALHLVPGQSPQDHTDTLLPALPRPVDSVTDALALRRGCVVCGVGVGWGRTAISRLLLLLLRDPCFAGLPVRLLAHWSKAPHFRQGDPPV